MLNDSLPGSRIEYSVYASCENKRVTGAVGRSEPSGFVPPGNGLSPPRPRCWATMNGAAARARAQPPERPIEIDTCSCPLTKSVFARHERAEGAGGQDGLERQEGFRPFPPLLPVPPFLHPYIPGSCQKSKLNALGLRTTAARQASRCRLSPIGAPGGASGAGMMCVGSTGPLEEPLDVGRDQHVLRVSGFARARLRLEPRRELASA